MASKKDGQRIVIRLNPAQVDEAALLADYAGRSDKLGRQDHDYIRRLLLLGYLVERGLLAGNNENDRLGVALSTNESNNTGKEQQSVLDNVSHGATTIPAAVPPADVAGTAIKKMANVFKGASGSAAESKAT